MVVMASWPFFWVQRNKHPLLHGLLRQIDLLLFRTVTPKNILRLDKRDRLMNPIQDEFIVGLKFAQFAVGRNGLKGIHGISLAMK